MAGNASVPVVFASLPGPGNQPLSLFDNCFAALTNYINLREVAIGTEAARPAPGVPGRWYFSTDSGGTLAVDTGSAWQAVALASFSGIAPEQFGAIGDGIHDDTTAIQSAVNAANGQAVRFGAKHYKITAPITLPLTGCALVGQGAQVSRLVAGQANFNMVQMIATAAGATGPLIRDLGFDAAGNADVQGINLNGQTTSTRVNLTLISGCEFFQCVVGITLAFCSNIWVTDCYMGACFIGVDLQTCADTNFTAVEVQLGNDVGWRFRGDSLPTSEGHRLTACSTNGQGEGLSIVGADWGIVSGCSFTSCPNGDVAALGISHHWRFTGCEFASAHGFAGIDIGTGAEQVEVVGCFFSLNTFAVVIGGGSRHVISNNSLEAQSNVDIVLQDTRHCAVTGNVCDSNGNPTSITELTGTGGGSDYNALTGNVCRGLVTTLGAHSLKTGNIENYT